MRITCRGRVVEAAGARIHESFTRSDRTREAGPSEARIPPNHSSFSELAHTGWKKIRIIPVQPLYCEDFFVTQGYTEAKVL